MRGRLPVACASVYFALRCSHAGAWGPDGHERIARIAEGLLTGKHNDQIRTMMHSDVIDTAGWEKLMTQKHPETGPLHWHRQEPEWTCGSVGGIGEKGHIRCDGHGAENGSLFCALAYFFEHFAHDTLLKEFPTPKEPIGTPDKLAVLEKIPVVELGTANYLKWLTILVGDLHQPLHWLHEHNFGREVFITYKGETVDLLHFWEEVIPKHLASLPKKAMHPDVTDKEYMNRSPAWEHKVPTELFREWAKEIAEKLCTEVYLPMTMNTAEGPKLEKSIMLMEPLFDRWAKIAEELMALAGERLAFVLNEIIEHKRHKDAHENGRGLHSRKVAIGTEKAAKPRPPLADTAMSDSMLGLAHGISTAESAEAEPDMETIVKQLQIEERQRSRSDACWNLACAAVLVPILLFAFRWHEGSGGANPFKALKHQKM